MTRTKPGWTVTLEASPRAPIVPVRLTPGEAERFAGLAAQWKPAGDSHWWALLFVKAVIPRLDTVLVVEPGRCLEVHGSLGILSHGERLMAEWALHLFNDQMCEKVSIEEMVQVLGDRWFALAMMALMIRRHEVTIRFERQGDEEAAVQ